MIPGAMEALGAMTSASRKHLITSFLINILNINTSYNRKLTQNPQKFKNRNDILSKFNVNLSKFHRLCLLKYLIFDEAMFIC